MSETKRVLVTFQKEFIVRKGQDTSSIGRMYKDSYGMDVVKIEDVEESDASKLRQA